jgi:hypothetical protein
MAQKETTMASDYEPPSMSLAPPIDLYEIDRQARAYGWEIGHGKELNKEIHTSPDNPFMDPNWRDRI